MQSDLNTEPVDPRGDAAPSEGEWIGASRLEYWARIASGFLIPGMAIVVVFVAGHTLDAFPPSVRRQLVMSGLAAMILLPILLWFVQRNQARYVNWNEHGIQIAYFYGKPMAFSWDELATMRSDRFDTDAESAEGASLWIKTRTGEGFRIGASVGDPRDYQALRSVLARHMGK